MPLPATLSCISYFWGPLEFPHSILLPGFCSWCLAPSPLTASVAVLPFSEATLLTTQPGLSLSKCVFVTPYHILCLLAPSSLMVRFVLFLMVLTTLWYLIHVLVFLFVDYLLPAGYEFFKGMDLFFSLLNPEHLEKEWPNKYVWNERKKKSLRISLFLVFLLSKALKRSPRNKYSSESWRDALLMTLISSSEHKSWKVYIFWKSALHILVTFCNL